MDSSTIEDTDLFAGIIEDSLVEVDPRNLPVPEDLREFDVVPTNQMIREAGEQVFLRWLRATLEDKPVQAPVSAESFICEDSPEMFFPNWPEPENYPLGEDDPNFLIEDHKEYLKVLSAKKVCDGCPFRLQCLAAAVVRDEEYGVWGGWGEGGRERVSNAFNRLRRDYNSERMTDVVRADYERRALAL